MQYVHAVNVSANEHVNVVDVNVVNVYMHHMYTCVRALMTNQYCIIWIDSITSIKQ